MHKLYPHQENLVKYTDSRGIILYWPCGSGKTLGALHLLDSWLNNIGNPRIVILTRATVKHQWERELRLYIPYLDAPLVCDGQTPTTLGYQDTVIVSYEILPHWVDGILRWAKGGQLIWIVDEVHALKSWKRKTKVVDASGHIEYKDADNIVAAAEKLSRITYKAMGLTATLLRDKLPDIWGQVDMIFPEALGTSWDYVHRYCAAHKNAFGGLDVSGSSNIPELKARLVTFLDKTTKEYIDSIMPSIRRDTIYISEQSKGLTLKELRAASKLGTQHAKEAKIVDATLRKFKWLKENLGDFSGGRMFISVSRRDLVPIVAKHILSIDSSLPIYTATGDTPIAERIAMVAKLDSQDRGCIVATMDSFAESIDNMQRIQTVLLLSLPDTEGELIQFEGRFRRLGGTNNRIIFLVATNTIDDHQVDMLMTKLEIYDTVMEEPDVAQMLNKLQLGGEREDIIAEMMKQLLTKLGE